MYCPVATKSQFLVLKLKKAAQQRNFCGANSIVLNQIFVYYDRVYSDNVKKNSGLRGPFLLNITPNTLSTLPPKKCYESKIKKMRDQILHFQGFSQFFALCETFQLFCNFRCDCYFVEWEYSWLQYCP